MENVKIYTLFGGATPMQFFFGPMNFFGKPLAPSKTLEKIISFQNLPTGWHFGEGGPVQLPVIQRAIKLYWSIVLQGIVRTDAFAGADGEILLTAYHGDHYFGVVIEQDGKMTFRHEFKDEELKYIEVDRLSEIEKAIGEAAGVIWRTTSDFFIQTTSSVSAIGLTSYHSSVGKPADYQSFIENAWIGRGPLALTHANSTNT